MRTSGGWCASASELGAQSDEIELCNQAALEGAMMLDRMEEEDAPNESR
jgi:hypothetical protein